MEEDSVMEERWGFLAPWCTVLKGRMSYNNVQPPYELLRHPKDCLLVKLPVRRNRGETHDKSEKTYQQELHKSRELLALLAAVEHVDHAAWKYILARYCGVLFGYAGSEEFESKVAVRFVAMFDDEKSGEDEALKQDVVNFFGVSQLEVSDEYLAALASIAALDSNLSADKPGVSIEIPVRLDVSQRRATDEDAIKNLKSVASAERVVQQQWTRYGLDTRRQNVSPGSLRCVFVLEPMIVDLDPFNISSDVARTIEDLVKDNVWFSQIALYPALEDNLLNSDARAAKLAYAQFVRSVFSSTTRPIELASTRYFPQFDRAHQYPEPPLQLGAVTVNIDDADDAMRACDYEAMCSAMAVMKTTKTLRINFEGRPKWLAYGLFSKRARTFSSVESISLTHVARMSRADMEAFAAIVASDHPEEDLFRCPRGAVPEQDAILKASAPIRWQFDGQGQPNLDLEPLTVPWTIGECRTFSDGGTSEWVNVLIPGFGRCQVQREDLMFYQSDTVGAGPRDLKTLTIKFDTEDPRSLDGVYSFFAAIGTSLKSLRLKIPRGLQRPHVNENVIISSCPKLETLLLDRDFIKVTLDLSEYRATRQPVPELRIRSLDVSEVGRDLSDSTNPFTKCARRLQVSLMARLIPVEELLSGAAPRSFESYVEPLVDMLKSNMSLEYLAVKMPRMTFLEAFRNHHLEPIHRRLKPFPIECKLAFLSALSARSMPNEPPMKRAAKPSQTRGELDQHVISRIFAFADPPVLRRVFYRPGSPPRARRRAPPAPPGPVAQAAIADVEARARAGLLDYLP